MQGTTTKVVPYTVDQHDFETQPKYEPRDEELEKNRPIWKGNWTVWWVIGSVVSLYFTGVTGVPIFFTRKIGPWFFIHLLTSCLVSWFW